MNPRIKFCGITNDSDLNVALEAGVDAVGFLVGQLHPSSDFIEPSLANQLARTVPPFVATVLVTHECDLRVIAAIAEVVPTQYLQIHSDMTPEELAAVRARFRPRRLIGKVSVENDGSIVRAQDIESSVDAILLDTINRVTGQVGGTGLIHDWKISARIRQAVRRPVILAGGLRPANVREAIQAVGPAGVDVNSGIEEQGGRKSIHLACQFVARVRCS